MEDFQVLTIPQIRSRLNQLNVPVPSNTCRKQELIDLLVQTLNSPPKPETRKRSVSPITVQKHPKAQSFFVKEVPSEAIPSTHLSHHKLGPIAYNPSTSLSNQKTDIFKQRMEAAFSQAQIEDAEIQSSSSVQLKESLGQIVIFIGILVSILLLSYVVRMWMAKPVFCGNGIIENCEQCPKNAICEGGNMACEPGYVRDRYACVEDKSVVSEAYKELWKLENWVIEKSTKIWLDERETFVCKLANYYDDQGNVENHLVREKFEQLIRDQVSLKIIYNEATNKILAKTPYLGLVPQLIVFWQDYKYAIALSGFFILYLLWRYIAYRQRKILQEMALKTYELIRNQIQSNVDESLEHGVMEAAIKQDIESKLGVKLTKNLWPIVEDLRRKDKNVTKFEAIIAGRPKILWQWKEEVKPVIGNKMKYL